MTSTFPSGLCLSGVALVTGGARGLGFAVACAFAHEGVRGVAILDVLPAEVMAQAKNEVELLGAKCITIHCDVTVESQVKKAIGETVAQFGRIDYAANFAGISGPGKSIVECEMTQVERTAGVNAFGLLHCVKYQMIQMAQQEPLTGEGITAQRGSIVNCASVNSFLAGHGAVAYTTSKHAVLGITKTAALEGRGKQVRVNSISPGFIRTDLVQAGIRHDKDLLAMWDACQARQGRKAYPMEIGNAVTLLSSPKMSLVAGTNLVVDGGFSINEMAF